VVSTGFDNARESLTRFRIAIASGQESVGEVFPGAEPGGKGEYTVTVRSIRELNTALADLIGKGALVSSVVPERSVLEQQFREAVGETK
jgi:hypothetical protein